MARLGRARVSPEILHAVLDSWTALWRRNRRKWRRLMRCTVLVFLMLVVAACTTPLADYDKKPPSAPTSMPSPPWVNPNPPIIGLPEGATCVPDVGQWLPDGARCSMGLTCRPLSSHDGRCRPIGPLPAGALTNHVNECGANMMLVSNTLGQAYCALICFPPSGQPRCGMGAVCIRYNGSDELGICQPIIGSP